MYEDITVQARTVVTELLDQARMRPGALFVVGCSSSEMVGQRIGKGSSMDAAQAAFRGIYPVLQEHGIHLAVQCCEHLNRALIMERAAAEQRGYEIVSVMPQPHAVVSARAEAPASHCHAQAACGTAKPAASPAIRADAAYARRKDVNCGGRRRMG